MNIGVLAGTLGGWVVLLYNIGGVWGGGWGGGCVNTDGHINIGVWGGGVGGGCVNTGGHINIGGGNYLVSITFK